MSERYKCPRCGGNLAKGSKTPAGKQRWVCRGGGKSEDNGRSYCYSTTDPESNAIRTQSGRKQKGDTNPQFKRKLSGVRRFVITAAQNATPVNVGFMSALLAYCEHNEAELVVIPIRYKNPTSVWPRSQANEEVWAPVLQPYLYNQRKKLNTNLVLLADIKTRPTADRPLSGFEAITHGESGILGHTKLQLQTIPTPQGRYPKILTTTGAITVPNYTDSKAGKKGEFHHTLAAVAVDVVGKKFHMRQINYDKKHESFIDLESEYLAVQEGTGWDDVVQTGLVEDAPRALGIAFGDTHRAQMDPKVERATFGPGGIVENLDPEYLVFHDLHDGLAVNHHERTDPFSQIALHERGANDAELEVRADVKWLRRVGAGRKVRLAASNHDDFLSRWIRDVDWRKDPVNSEFYLESALELVRAVKSKGEAPDVFSHWVEKLKEDADIRCLSRRESFMLAGIEMGLHGDLGPNGARGSAMNLRRIGVKTVIGHSHSPAIEEGCYQVGTSSKLDLGYNRGPSSWLHCHCVVYSNGKRSLLIVVDGKWRI